MASRFKFHQVLGNLEQLKRELPIQLANDTRNFFAASWRKGGWEDNGVQRWEEPKRKKYSGKNAKRKRAATRATLVKSGRLRRAVQDSIRSTTMEEVKLVVDVPYAARHNEGLDGMPQRQFMGDSAALRRIQRNRITKTVDKIWQA